MTDELTPKDVAWLQRSSTPWTIGHEPLPMAPEGCFERLERTYARLAEEYRELPKGRDTIGGLPGEIYPL